MSKIKNISLTLIVISALVIPQYVLAAGQIDSKFNPDRLIDDKVFSDRKAMGSASEVQKFLEAKNSVLASKSESFIAMFHEPTSSSLKQTLEDPHANSSTPRTAAELIWDAAQSSGINPQVLLVTLQKEQSLITGRKTNSQDQLQRALDFALGFGCPDSAACGELYRGFYFQLFGNVDAEGNRYLGAAKSLMKSFNTPGGRGPYYNGSIAKVGDTIILGNTLGGYDGVQAQQEVTIKNSATAALYRFTPHVFNGNYNFWRYMKEWFDGGASNGDSDITLSDGTIIKNSKKYYYILNGSRYTFNKFVEKYRKIKTSKSKSVSSKTFASIPDAGQLGLADNTVVKTESGTYVFVGNKLFVATESALAQRGLSASNSISAKDADLKEFLPALVLPPQEGAVLKGDQNPQVYYVENAQLRLVSSVVYEQKQLAGRIVIIPEAELAQYPKGGYLVPDDGTVVKSDRNPTVYIFLSKIKRPIPSPAVLKTYGKTFADVKALSQEEIDAMPEGTIAEPKDSTYYQIQGTGQLWVYRNNSRHYIAPFVAKQRGITPDVTLQLSESNTWPEGDCIMPKDGTLIKSDKSPAVYIIEGGEMLALSGSQFKSRGLSFANIQTLPDSDVKKFVANSSAQ